MECRELNSLLNNFDLLQHRFCKQPNYLQRIHIRKTCYTYGDEGDAWTVVIAVPHPPMQVGTQLGVAVTTGVTGQSGLKGGSV